jgi:hypothetical protein
MRREERRGGGVYRWRRKGDSKGKTKERRGDESGRRNRRKG